MQTSTGHGELYQTVFGQVLTKCESMASSSGFKKKFRFKNKLASLDSSTIRDTRRSSRWLSRCWRMYRVAQPLQKFISTISEVLVRDGLARHRFRRDVGRECDGVRVVNNDVGSLQGPMAIPALR